MKKSGIILIVLFVSLAGVACSSSPAARLADADGQSGDVAQYDQALDDLAAKCTDERSLLADYALTAQELLDNGGQSETLLEILQHVSLSIPAGSPRMSCSDIFAAYTTLRGGKA